MSAPSDSQIGYKKETTWAQHAVVDHFLPLIIADLAYTADRLESEGVVAGLDIIGSQQWNGGNITAGGNVGHELYAGGLDFLLELIFGEVDITGAGPYTKVFQPTTGELPSGTVQIGRARPGLGVIPENWVGAKVGDWQLACSQGAIATIGVGLSARTATFGTRQVSDGVTNSTTTVTSAAANFTEADLDKLVVGTGIPAGTSIVDVVSESTVTLSAAATATATGVTLTIGAALATASYAAGSTKPLKFNHATLSLLGSSVDFTAVNVAGNNALASGRRFHGSGLIREQVREGRREFTATVSKEYLGLDARTALLNGTEGALVLNFTAGAAQVQLEGNVRHDKADSTADAKKIATEELGLKFVLPDASTDLGDAIKVTTINAAATV